MVDYRQLTVRSIRLVGENDVEGKVYEIGFLDCPLSFYWSERFMNWKGLKGLKIGDKIEVHGNRGNSDKELQRLGLLIDARVPLPI